MTASFWCLFVLSAACAAYVAASVQRRQLWQSQRKNRFWVRGARLQVGEAKFLRLYLPVIVVLSLALFAMLVLWQQWSAQRMTEKLARQGVW